MHRNSLALNNQQVLICHKTKQFQVNLMGAHVTFQANFILASPVAYIINTRTLVFTQTCVLSNDFTDLLPEHIFYHRNDMNNQYLLEKDPCKFNRRFLRQWDLIRLSKPVFGPYSRFYNHVPTEKCTWPKSSPAFEIFVLRWSVLFFVLQMYWRSLFSKLIDFPTSRRL